MSVISRSGQTSIRTVFNEMFDDDQRFASDFSYHRDHALIYIIGSLIPRLVWQPEQPHHHSTRPQSRPEHLVPLPHPAHRP